MRHRRELQQRRPNDLGAPVADGRLVLASFVSSISVHYPVTGVRNNQQTTTTGHGGMADIFLSYASEDRDKAETLAAALERQGWTVFWDRTILAGKRFMKVIDEELSQAGCVVAMWSAISVEKDWVLEEAEDGKKLDILVPVYIELVTPPRGFRLIQAEDLSDWDGSDTSPAFCQLVKAVEAKRARRQQGEALKPAAFRSYISYRREDSAGYATLLYQLVANAFGREAVFLDFGEIQLGADPAISDFIAKCDVLFAMIGPKWLSIENDRGRRLADAEDYVRREIAFALSQEVLVLPVLIDEADPPPRAELPSEIGALVNTRAVALHVDTFERDVGELIQFLAGRFHVAPLPQPELKLVRKRPQNEIE